MRTSWDTNNKICSNNSLVREYNEHLILAIMRKHMELSRSDLQRLSRLTYPTVTKAIGNLMERGLLDESGEGHSRGGRKPKLVKFCEKAGIFIGIEVNKKFVKLGSFYLDHSLRSQFTLTLENTQPATVRDTIIEGVKRVQASMEPEQRIFGIGIGCPGMINPETGHVLSKSSLKWLEPVNLGEELITHLNIPTRVDNDINTAALGEMSVRDLHQCDSWAYISVATGVGSGIILNNQILRGHAGSAGELGHLSVDAKGLPCDCGGYGCLETYLSAGALAQALGVCDVTQNPYEILRLEFEKGSELGVRIYHDVLTYMVTAIGSMINLLNPFSIIIGGDIQALGSAFLDSLKDAVGIRSGNVHFDPEQLYYSELGSQVVIHGAAVMVDHDVFGKDLYVEAQR